MQIPHEFGDFAILLKSGFDRCHKNKHKNIFQFQSNRRTKEKKTMIRWEAARAQISTALVGLLGALVALAFESSDDLETLLM